MEPPAAATMSVPTRPPPPVALADPPAATATVATTAATTANTTTSSTTSAAAATAPPSGSPAPDCYLRLLMVNGDSFRLVLPASTTVHALKQRVLDQPPTELVEFLKESTPPVTTWPSRVDEIRILHLGKFLEDAKTLKEYNFTTGPENQTTVHISVRVPTHATDDVKDKRTKKGNACCAVM